MKKLQLHWQILIALVLAAIAGSLAGTEATLFGVRYYAMFGFIGIAGIGFPAIVPLAWLFFSVLAGLAVHFLVVLPTRLYFAVRAGPEPGSRNQIENRLWIKPRPLTG